MMTSFDIFVKKKIHVGQKEHAIKRISISFETPYRSTTIQMSFWLNKINSNTLSLQHNLISRIINNYNTIEYIIKPRIIYVILMGFATQW